MLGFYTPSFFGLAAFTVCFFGWALFELWVNLRQGRSGSTNRDRFSRYLIIVGIIGGFVAAMFATIFLRLADITVARPAVFYIGLVLMIVGLIFRAYAIRQLGKFFLPEVIVQPDHRIYQEGLYRYLRHPSYTGTLMTVFGYGLALTNWVSLLIMLTVFFKVYSIRIVVEEAALIEAFGDEYRQYMKRTKRLIPYIL
jgi:protein-S-isoprenylcysteine O-methyltransferase Ste14